MKHPILVSIKPAAAQVKPLRRSAPRKRARRPTGSPATRGTSACWGTRVRRSPPPRWATHSMPATATSKLDASAATRTRPLRSNIVRRPKTTPIHELERYMRCKDCSGVQGYPYKRSHLVALRPTKIQPAIRPRRGGRASGDGGCIRERERMTKQWGAWFAGTIMTSKTGAKCSSHLLTHGSRYMAPILCCDPNLLMA